MHLEVIHDPSPASFIEHAAPFLYTDEPANSLILGLCDNLSRANAISNSSPLFIRVLREDRIATVAVQSPPRNLILTHAGEEELRQLAKHLWESGIDIPGVVGPGDVIDTFVNLWTDLSGKSGSLALELGILKIENVRAPAIEGRLHVAKQKHVRIIAEWMVAFADESLPHKERRNLADSLIDAQRIVERECAYVWLVDDEPVSMVHVARHTENGASLNAVFTPQEKRKHGYASAAVAHLSQQLLDSGKRFCVLYTDLANPTSNKIYRSIGYEQVGNSKNYMFHSA